MHVLSKRERGKETERKKPYVSSSESGDALLQEACTLLLLGEQRHLDGILPLFVDRKQVGSVLEQELA